MFGFFKRKKKDTSSSSPRIRASNNNEPMSGKLRGKLEIKAAAYDDENERFQIEFDWDDEFIESLREHGYTGASDEAIAQKYIAVMYKHIIESMGEDLNDFE